MVVHANNANWFGCSFFRNTNATDVVFNVQVAGILATQAWSTVAAWSTSSGWSGPGRTWETGALSNRAKVTVLDIQPMLGATNRFMLLRVSQP